MKSVRQNTPLGRFFWGQGLNYQQTGTAHETRGEAARTGIKISTPFISSFDASIGIRATYTPKKDD